MAKKQKDLIILFKVTSRSRPEKFKYTINNIIEKCDGVQNFILASIDTDDLTMNTKDIVNFCEERNVILKFGLSKNKIDAINRDVDKFTEDLLPDWDILVNVSDDQSFTTQGFDNIIRKDFLKSFPDTDGVLHYPDGNRKDLMTMSIIGRKYYDHFGRIYHQEYISVFCDDDAMHEAQLLKKYKFIDNPILVHEHPAYGKADWDAQYKHNESPAVHAHDQAIFAKRQSNNFGI